MARKPTAPPQVPASVETKQQPENGLRESIEREIGPLVTPGQREIIVSRMQTIMFKETFSGPIAHPRHLREYDAIVPGSADRIIAMAEKQQNHTIALEASAIKADIDDRKLGMWLGFTSLIVLVGLAAVFGYLDKPIIAGLFLTAAALGSVVAFINGRMGSSER